jgi:hypothetical protein
MSMLQLPRSLAPLRPADTALEPAPVTPTTGRPSRGPLSRSGSLGALPVLFGVASSAGGLALAATFGAVARLRRGRPLHPQGASWAGTVAIPGGADSGVPWLDVAGVHEVTLRVSRGVGLPVALPDVYGLAVRVHGMAPGPADLLFASTGDSPLGRFLFAPRGAVGNGPMTTLLPVRSERGPLVLRLTPVDRAPVPERALPSPLLLSYALSTGDWWPVGEVRVGHRLGPEAELERHDPVAHPLPSTVQYEVVRRLRGPAYRAARGVPARVL